jgi:molybdopterin-containing oxidoreductase family membrane subunit
MQNNTLKICLLLGCLGMVVGVYGLYEALTDGAHSTALTSAFPWGLGVVSYLYFLGLSGGGLFIATLTVIWRQKQFEAFSGMAAWAVVVTEICAGIAILSDLGHWERSYRFITSPNFQSPMAWMFVFFIALLIVYCLKVLALRNGDAGRAHSLTLVSMPVALLFYLTNGYIFGMISAQPMWSGAFTPVWFLLAALLSGGALVGVLGWANAYNAELMRDYGSMLFRLVLAFAVFEVLYLVTAAQGGDAETQKALQNLLWGSGSLLFWGAHVCLGTLLPLFLLAKPANSGQVGIASLVIVLSFLPVRWNFVVPVQGVEPLEGLAEAFQHARLAYSYAPSTGEWLVTIFVSSLCLVTLLIGPRIFPVLFNKQGERHV